MKTKIKIMQIVVVAVTCAMLASIASAAQQPRRSFQPPPRAASRPMQSRAIGSSGRVANSNFSRAPFRSPQSSQVNKSATMSKTTGLNKGAPGNGSKAPNKSATLNKSGSVSNKTAALSKNKNSTISKNTNLAKNTTLNKNVAANTAGKFHPIDPIPPKRNVPTLKKPQGGGGPIPNSQNWKGSKYACFRDYRSVWQTRGWWVSHYNTIVFVSGGWYAWEAGYWIPAWGYDADAVYYYDGPIACACTAVEAAPPNPCDIVANVQSVLQQQGYYQGDIDGVLSPDTQNALSAYQQAQGLEVTGAVDQPTLESLGLA